MLESLKKIFASEEAINKKENKDIDILSGLMIEAANIEESLESALNNKDNSKSLYFYTSKLNKSFTSEKKIMLIEVLWEVILSDNEIHDFETNLIRRLAGLLYISDIECGNAKIRASKKVQSL